MSEDEQIFSQQRQIMLREQIQARGIKDRRLLAAMGKVKRHLFVPAESRHLAYQDYPLSIGQEQTISQPYIVALMTELLALKGGERVLEIGLGSGYQTAILAELAKEVYAIDRLEYLATAAGKLLEDSGYRNVHVQSADGFLGWPQQAPFQAIMVTCAPEIIPAPLIAQLTEGGKLVIPVGGGFSQELQLARKIDGKVEITGIIPVSFVPLVRSKEAL